MKNFLSIFFAVVFSLSAFAQNSDTIAVKKKPAYRNDSSATAGKHSPTKATLLSLAVPGLGQCYNKKWWKVPIIYGGFAALTYGVIFNHTEFHRFKTAYGYRVDGDSLSVDEFNGQISDAELLSNTDFYRRNRDLSYIGIGLLYVLNIIDAAVDAHLYDFDVSDNLSMRVQPEFRSLGYTMQPYTGARVTFVLK